MRVYIMTDMEGVAGILNFDDYCTPESRYYERARELATLEVSAAVEGALIAGATEVLVVDGHGCGAMDPLHLHPAAKLYAGRPMGYPFHCDDTFDAAMVVGQHARSNTDGGHLSHTGWFNCEEMTINGVSVGELGCNMLFAAYSGVPTVMVAGDLACCEEAKALVPGIETAAVKEGDERGPATGLTSEQNKLHNGAAVHLHPAKARELIRGASERGLRRLREIPRFWLEPPYEFVSTTRRSDEEPGKRAVAHSDDLLELLSMPKEFK
jgi:D-amino peptidase